MTESPPPDDPFDPVRALQERLEAAEPDAPRSLGELMARLGAEGRLRGSATLDPVPAALPVRGLAFDSRQVRPGWLFVAVPGAHVNGSDFVASVARQGAVAAIVEQPLSGSPLPQIVVDRAQAALATAACWWYGDPSRELGIVGITGTDGKTTTSFLAAAVLRAAGISAGIVTTAGIAIGDVESLNPEHVTTPEAPQLQRMLRAMVRAGDEAAIVESTSHGLALERVGGIAYDVAIFTNLTHEHLEFHRTFQAYRDAKLSLFERLARGPAKSLRRAWPATAIVNRDDEAAPLFEAAATAAGARTISYGEAQSADVRATSIAEDARSLRFTVATPRWGGSLSLQLAGRFNVHNALAAVALGEALELDPELVRAGLAGVRGVPGRMERVDCGQPFGVVVDYAHSPASLEKVLDMLSELAAARGGGVIAVFGSAGERDVQKRPMMGLVAGRRCRQVILTNEDPRNEDPSAILEQIAVGVESAGLRRDTDLHCIVDRNEAIAAAFEQARPGDWVLLAGKGHERSIITAAGPEPWNERTAAERALEISGLPEMRRRAKVSETAAPAGNSTTPVRATPATSADEGDWHRFLAEHPAGDPLQAWGWAEVTAVGGERPVRLIARDDAGKVRGVAQILVRPTSFGRSVLYIPHGPIWDWRGPAGDAALDRLLEGIRRTGRVERGIVAKIDPRAASSIEPAGLAADRINLELERRGLRLARVDLQARTTRVLDLRPGPDALLASFDKDTRNLLRRAEREGVTARVFRDADHAAYRSFAELLAATSARGGFHSRSADALVRLAEAFAPSGAAYLVLAELGGRPIAGCLALVTGRRAFYLYAASLREDALRHANGPYLALWTLCRALIVDGIESLDLWGVAEAGDPTADPEWAGFSLFKRGFGGERLTHPGAMDMVISPAWYRLRDWRERRASRT